MRLIDNLRKVKFQQKKSLQKELFKIFLYRQCLKSMWNETIGFSLNTYSHLLDKHSVSSWSKIFMTLPQRSGLESLGHKVIVGKTALSRGITSTFEFIGFSYQPESLNCTCKTFEKHQHESLRSWNYPIKNIFFEKIR